MSDDKFVDPRLQAKEAVFQQLHLSTFDVMANAQTVIDEVNKNGTDVEDNNESYLQLLRDYQVTKAMTKLDGSSLVELCNQTDVLIKNKNIANASMAQICAAATNSLNHWRILCEIPDDLREVREISGQLKENYKSHLSAWKRMVNES